MGKFRSDDVKTGDIICYTGSTASAAYFPDRVVDDNGTHEIGYRIIMPPTFEGGNAVAPSKEPAWRWRNPTSSTNTLPASS